MKRNALPILNLLFIALAIVSCKSEDADEGDTIAPLLPDEQVNLEGTSSGSFGVLADQSDAQIESFCRREATAIYPGIVRAFCQSVTFSTSDEACVDEVNSCIDSASMSMDINEGCGREELSLGCMYEQCIESMTELRDAGCQGELSVFSSCVGASSSASAVLTAEDLCSGETGEPSFEGECDEFSEDAWCGFEREVVVPDEELDSTEDFGVPDEGGAEMEIMVAPAGGEEG